MYFGPTGIACRNILLLTIPFRRWMSRSLVGMKAYYIGEYTDQGKCIELGIELVDN
jgi:hypothetical protein